MASPALSHPEHRHSHRTRKVNTGLVVTIVLQLVVWIFSAGMLWQKVNDLDRSVSELKQEVHQHWGSTAPPASHDTRISSSQ